MGDVKKFPKWINLSADLVAKLEDVVSYEEDAKLVANVKCQEDDASSIN
jgi:hypothetical protein